MQKPVDPLGKIIIVKPIDYNLIVTSYSQKYIFRNQLKRCFICEIYENKIRLFKRIKPAVILIANKKIVYKKMEIYLCCNCKNRFFKNKK